jgi:predicted nucleic acid-binding protein
VPYLAGPSIWWAWRAGAGRAPTAAGRREPGSDRVRELMTRADAWFICRNGFLETARAVAIVAGPAAVRRVRSEWPALGVLEVDSLLMQDALELALSHRLRSLDALHLAAALVLPRDDLTLATWDRGLHAAALAEGLSVVPAALG